MKSIIFLIICLLACSVAFSQSRELSVYLFHTDSIALKETNLGSGKKYEIRNTNTDSTLRSFVIYNDETPQFYRVFEETINELRSSNSPNFDAIIPANNADVYQEGKTTYMRLRNMNVIAELNAADENNLEPKAGTLIVASNVKVQQVDRKMKKQVKNIMREKYSKLSPISPIKIKPYKQENNWVLVEISKSESSKLKYKEELFLLKEDQKKSGSAVSREFYNKKKKVKRRLLELVVDSIINSEYYQIEKLLKQTDSIKQTLARYKQNFNDLEKKINREETDKQNLEKQLKSLESQKQAMQKENTDLQQTITSISVSMSGFPNADSIINQISSLRESSNYNNYYFEVKNSANSTIQGWITGIRDSIDNKILLQYKLSLEIDSLNLLIKNNDNFDSQVEMKKFALQFDTLKISNEINTLRDQKGKLLKVLKDIDNAIQASINSQYQDEIDTRFNILIEKKTIATDSIYVLDSIKKNLVDIIQHNEALHSQFKNKLADKLNSLSFDSMCIDSIQIEFNDGSIENIQAIGLLERSQQVLKFSNIGPIGFTSKTEIDQLNNRWLFADPGTDYVYSINAGQLIKDYYEKHEVDRRDYSPRNQVITISRKNSTLQLQHPKHKHDHKKNDTDTYDSVFKKDVYKEYSRDILTGTVFTDLNGINGNEPNGIIQTEFYKEMSIYKRRYTFRKPMYNTKKVNLNVTKKRDLNFGIFSYITPHFVISKIENENKNLELSYKQSIINNQIDTIYYANTMDLRKHETFRIGLRLNLFFLDIPSAKTTIYFGWSVYGARVPVIKPITENQPVQNKFITNTFEHGPELAAELFTDERYGLRISGAFKWYYAFTDQFQQVSNSVEFSESPEIQDVTPGEPGYWKFSMLAYLKPKRDGKGKIFFRYNYFSPYKSIDLAWSQIQLGYAFSLTSTELPASLK